MRASNGIVSTHPKGTAGAPTITISVGIKFGRLTPTQGRHARKTVDDANSSWRKMEPRTEEHMINIHRDCIGRIYLSIYQSMYSSRSSVKENFPSHIYSTSFLFRKGTQRRKRAKEREREEFYGSVLGLRQRIQVCVEWTGSWPSLQVYKLILP